MIAEVRGEGLLIGLRAVVPSGELVDALRAEKLLTVAAGDNVVRLLPPLIVERGRDRRGGAAHRPRLRRASARRCSEPQAGSGRMSTNGIRHFLDLIDIPAAGAARHDRREPRHEGAAASAGDAPASSRSPARRWR